MADKSGGDIAQMNAGLQGNASMQEINSIAAAGVGAVGGIGGSDNVHADTNVFGV